MNSFVLFQSSLIPLLLITFFLLINIQGSVYADTPEYGNCSQPITCGGVKSNISYPFWGENRPDYCGKSGFNVTCQDDVPMITMKTITFRLLNMRNSTTTAVPTVTVAREDYWNTLCPRRYIDTDLNYSLFDYASGPQNVSFYYGCNSAAAVGLSVIGFNSTSITRECSSTLSVSFLTEKQTAMVPDATTRDACADVVLVPVSAAAAERLDNNQTSTIQDDVNGGFELNVQNEETGLCNNCVASGGFCGQNTTVKFICYCQSETTANTCGSNSATPNSETPNSAPGSSSGINYILAVSAYHYILLSLLLFDFNHR